MEVDNDVCFKTETEVNEQIVLSFMFYLNRMSDFYNNLEAPVFFLVISPNSLYYLVPLRAFPTSTLLAI